MLPRPTHFFERFDPVMLGLQRQAEREVKRGGEGGSGVVQIESKRHKDGESIEGKPSAKVMFDDEELVLNPFDCKGDEAGRARGEVSRAPGSSEHGRRGVSRRRGQSALFPLPSTS